MTLRVCPIDCLSDPLIAEGAMSSATTPKLQAEKESADHPSETAHALRQDIRLLGRLLGDTIREQEGPEVFETVEQIRQAAVQFAREGEPSVRQALESQLNGLPKAIVQTIVRAFSHFLQLANVAEDVHHTRRRRAHELAGSPPYDARPSHQQSMTRCWFICSIKSHLVVSPPRSTSLEPPAQSRSALASRPSNDFFCASVRSHLQMPLTKMSDGNIQQTS